MTVTSIDSLKVYAGTGALVSFATPAFQTDADLEVVLRDTDGSPIAWFAGTQYTLSGAGATGGGLLTVKTTPTDYTPQDGQYLYILLNPAQTQGTDFGGANSAVLVPLIAALDKVTLLIQAVQAEVARALKVPGYDLTLISGLDDAPLDIDRAGKILAFASDGQPTVVDPATLAISGVGDTLPIDAARAVVYKTGATGTTLSFILSALTASRSITMPDANVDLGKLIGIATAFASGDLGKVLGVGGTGTTATLLHPVGHQNPGVTSPGDASYALVHGTTKQLIRYSAELTTTSRTLSMAPTDAGGHVAWAGISHLIECSGTGANALVISGFGDSDDSTAVLLDGEAGIIYYDGSHWRFLGPLFKNRAIDLRGGIIRGYVDNLVTISADTDLTTRLHSGCRLNCTNSSDITLTITDDADPAVGVTSGFVCTVIRKGTGAVNFAAGGSLTLQDPDATSGTSVGLQLRYGAATLFVDASDVVISGRTS